MLKQILNVNNFAERVKVSFVVFTVVGEPVAINTDENIGPDK